MTDNEYHATIFDPGGAATGWAHFCVDFRAFSRPEHKILRFLKYCDCGEFTGTEAQILKQGVAHIDHTLSPQGYDANYMFYDVIGEDFELTQMIGGKNLLSPVRINAVLDWECQKRGIKYQYLARQLRTGTTKKRLELYGFGSKWTTTGKGKDKFAAMQHGIYWLRHIKDLSKRRPWKLSEGGILNSYWDCNCIEGKKCDLVHPKDLGEINVFFR
jgi:hypothetical protein